MTDAPDVAPTTPALRALVALGGRGGRWQTFARGAVVAGAAVEVWKKAAAQSRDRLAYTVSVDGRDEVFDPVHDWLLDRIPDHRRRSLVASTGRHGSDDGAIPDDMGRSRSRRQVRVRYDGTRWVRATIAGHQVRVHVEEERLGDRGGGRVIERKIVFASATAGGRDAVLALLDELAAGVAPGPRLYMTREYGGWERASESPTRPLSSVVLRAGQLERIVGDLDRFLSLESTYARLGLPWHHGFLFHGVPGSGKSSAARAVAANAGLDVYYLPLSDLKADTDLHRLVGSIGRGALVVEDVDVVHAARERDDSTRGVSMSGLLNVLDGIATPHGLVTFMTTNDAAALDDALTRPGRCDLREEFLPLDADQFVRLWEAMTGVVLPFDHAAALWAEKKSWTPADVLDVIKPHLGDEDAALDALIGLL